LDHRTNCFIPRNESPYPLNRRLPEHQNQPGRPGEEKCLLLLPIFDLLVVPPAVWTLYRLHYSSFHINKHILVCLLATSENCLLLHFHTHLIVAMLSQRNLSRPFGILSQLSVAAAFREQCTTLQEQYRNINGNSI